MSSYTLSKFGKPTKRQYQILMLRLQGYSYRQIADQIFRSDRTVEHNLRNLKDRLGMEFIEEVYNIARAKRWIEYKIKPYDEIEVIRIQIG